MDLLMPSIDLLIILSVAGIALAVLAVRPKL
jgi:hypothetical protein